MSKILPSSCKVAGCKEKHSNHICYKCKDLDSNHFILNVQRIT